MRKPKRHPKGKLIEGYLCKNHPLIVTWRNMWRRCIDSKSKEYENYGARGISVCERWEYFENFVNDMGPKPDFSYSLERKNNEKDYDPSNCTWETRSNQCVNRRVFKTNTTGFPGVVKIQNKFEARFDYQEKRYRLGRFDNIQEANKIREKFLSLFFIDKNTALKLIPKETVWGTSSTKTRGITTHPDGGFVARCTINGTRHYIGYFKTAEEAENARIEFIKSKTG